MATQATRARRFEYIGGTSRKFWTIGVHGTEVLVRFGRIGTEGQQNTKSFLTEGAAAQHAAKLVQEKTGKGYVEVS